MDKRHPSPISREVSIFWPFDFQSTGPAEVGEVSVMILSASRSISIRSEVTSSMRVYQSSSLTCESSIPLARSISAIRRNLKRLFPSNNGWFRWIESRSAASFSQNVGYISWPAIVIKGRCRADPSRPQSREKNPLSSSHSLTSSVRGHHRFTVPVEPIGWPVPRKLSRGGYG